MKKLSTHYKLWFSTDDRKSVLGNGKYNLLKAIKEEGSLSMAAKKLHVSYRKAWGDLNKAESGLGIKLTEKKRGGKDGGNTVLTEKGEKILEAYSLFNEKVGLSIEQSFNQFLKRIAE